jgi:molybdopterin molybdotransferase
MITVQEAHECIGRHARPLEARQFALAELLGLQLAEDVASGVDSPPFDKSVVDGYAISTSDPSDVLREVELVAAGGVAARTVERGTTIRVMTGAPIPSGADAVVKWEDCQLQGDGAILRPAHARPGACILPRGAAFARGERVLQRGKRIGPLDIALLAEIGRPQAAAIPRPRIGVLPTGDELVAAHEPAGPGQIRNSNGPMLLAALAVAGAAPVDLGIGRDDRGDLREKIARGLSCDVLLVSGGVSAGVKDLVPGVLAELGVSEQFHKVRIKPGKPLWFGVREQPGRSTLVFGLPGNPVSTLVSYRLFVAPALEALSGRPYAPPAAESAVLSTPFAHRGQRPTYHPCRRVPGDSPLRVEPLDWKGSADLATLTHADCLAVFPEGDYALAAGSPVAVLPL